ncbi:MAG: hypothetical protein IMZ61_02985 [Planctomycetes bacterium]|nr:hypothetical protein [Planctomycetota bacterium]
MGYSLTIVSLKAYYPSDAVLVTNLAAKTTVSGSYVKLKEIRIAGDIVPGSLFRFKFDLRNLNAVRLAYARIYINGIAAGTEQTRNANVVATFTEDLTHAGWNVGDTIELWAYLAGGGGDTAEVSNFKICGIGSEFENTLGA